MTGLTGKQIFTASIFIIGIAATGSGNARDLAKVGPIPSWKASAPGALLSAQLANSLSQSDISEAQLQLRDLGLYDGALDGVIGPQMKEALLRFQKNNGLEETAALDPLTMVAMFGNIGTSGRRRASVSGREDAGN